MRGSMTWNDTAKAAGLAALAGRTSTTASNAIDTRRIWAPHDVWLLRTTAWRFEPAVHARDARGLSVRITDR